MTTRPLADRCPGLLTSYPAADGALARLRVPGGRVPTAVLREVARLATEHGAPFVQLTSRANLQLRGLSDPLPTSLIEAVTELGLLPSPTHERVRNIMGAPFSDVGALATQVDEALCSEPSLARLPGRFLVTLDDERALLRDEPADFSYRRHTVSTGVLSAAAGRFELPLTEATVVPELVRRAVQFVAEREAMAEPAWNTWELNDDSVVFTGMQRVASQPSRSVVRPEAGPVDHDLVVAVPSGLLTLAQADALAELVPVVTLTGWRRIVVPGSAESDPTRLTDAGLVVTPSGWDRITACIGSPYCRRSAIDTLSLATGVAAEVSPTGEPLHISGCDRRCGSPRGRHVDLLAPRSVEEALRGLQ